jgi:ABC-type transporter lipoprotein component MlaA
LEALREGSVDYYATLRNAYFQRRAEQLREIGVDVVARNGDPD